MGQIAADKHSCENKDFQNGSMRFLTDPHPSETDILMGENYTYIKLESLKISQKA